MHIRNFVFVASCFTLTACGQPSTGETADTRTNAQVTTRSEDTADTPPVATPTLQAGIGSLSCEMDWPPPYGDGRTHLPITSLDLESLRTAVRRCLPSRVLHVNYSGVIDNSFALLMQRLSSLTKSEQLSTLTEYEWKHTARMLSIDSPGGDVEAAISAGEAIADTYWIVDVRAKAECYSACVFVLAAGGARWIQGAVGIHRMLPRHSQAETRSDLAKELQGVSVRAKTYLATQGVNPSLVDRMMTISADNLVVLGERELDALGLGFDNAAQKDLERAKLVKKCGEDFVRRKDAFNVAHRTDCAKDFITNDATAEVTRSIECGLRLSERFDFPDAACPTDGPMYPFDQRGE